MQYSCFCGVFDSFLKLSETNYRFLYISTLLYEGIDIVYYMRDSRVYLLTTRVSVSVLCTLLCSGGAPNDPHFLTLNVQTVLPEGVHRLIEDR